MGGATFSETVPLLAGGTFPQEEQITWYLYMAALLSALGGFLFGYDTGVVSGALLQLRTYFKLNTVWQEVIVSVTIAGAWMFSVLAGKLNDWLGRKPTVLLASFLFTFGSILMGISSDKWMLASGRWVVGLGVGLSSMTAPMYIAEVSPTKFRGRLVTVNQLFITCGQFVASVVDGIFSVDEVHGWRYMLGLAAIPAIFQGICFLFMPESPRWLCGKGKHALAEQVLRQLRGTNADIQTELQEMKTGATGVDASRKGTILSTVWADPFLRKRLIVGIMLMVFQQIVAINTVMYYSATIIEMSGFRNQRMAIWLSAGVAFVNFVFSSVGVCLVERVGRRKLTLSSLAGIATALAILSAGFWVSNSHSPAVTQTDVDAGVCASYKFCKTCILDPTCAFLHDPTGKEGMCVKRDYVVPGLGNSTTASDQYKDWILEDKACPVSGHLGYITLAGLALYLVFFAPGMGPMPWTINSELFPLWCRSTCFAVATSFNWLFNLVISLTFLSLVEALTQQGVFLLYMAFAIVGFIYFYYMLPETKGTSLDSVTEKTAPNTVH